MTSQVQNGEVPGRGPSSFLGIGAAEGDRLGHLDQPQCQHSDLNKGL